MPAIDIDAIENHLKAAKEAERRVRILTISFLTSITQSHQP